MSLGWAPAAAPAGPALGWRGRPGAAASCSGPPRRAAAWRRRSAARALRGWAVAPARRSARRPSSLASLPLPLAEAAAAAPSLGGAEAALLGIAAALYIGGQSQPKSAPGPDLSLKLRLQRAERDLGTARVLFEQASACYADANESLGLRIDRAAPEILETARKRLAQATKNLSEAREEMRRAEADLRNYPVPAFLAAERKRGTVMIAVTGAAGVGKSSLVNALCGFRPKDPVGAETGVVETTCEPLMFRLPGHARILRPLAEEKAEVCIGDRLLLSGAERRLEGTVAEVVSAHSEDTWTVRLEDGTDMVVGLPDLRGALVSRAIWDLPGVGTQAFPQETYLKRMGIRHFDAVILVTASRFTEADVMLLDELRHWKVPFLLVRNKIDLDVQQEIERESEFCLGDPDYDGLFTEHRRQEVMRQVVVQVREHLKALHSLEHVHCVSARRKFRNDFDFGSLEAGITATSESQRAATEEDEELLFSPSASEALAAEALGSALGRH